MSTPPRSRVVICTDHGIKLQMTAVNRIVEVEIIRINGDTLILLGINLSVITQHRSLYVGRTIAIIRNSHVHLSTVHGSEPCTPVILRTAQPQVRIIVIASTPSVVVGTNHSILVIIIVRQDDHEVIPVVGTAGVVGEGSKEGLTRSHLDFIRVSTPPGCRVVGSTETGVHLVNDLKLCIADDRCCRLALESLSISSHEGLLAQIVHIGNDLEGQVTEIHIL